MGRYNLEKKIIDCGETNYPFYKRLIHDTFNQMMNNMKVIRSISERVLELILENNDIDLLRKYSYYYNYVINQSYSHYHEYAVLFNSKECVKYLEQLHDNPRSTMLKK
jgi:hypothetical protein